MLPIKNNNLSSQIDTGLVFISGGSALNKIAGMLAESKLSTTHIISVFDNGGSTGLLRTYCGIAVGDIRNRLVALGEKNNPIARTIGELFSIRLHGNKPRPVMRRTVEELAEGSGEHLAALPAEISGDISGALKTLLSRLPDSFDWREGSIGNCILVGKYLQTNDWTLTLDWAHQAVYSCGLVIPTTIESAHLGAYLINGTTIVGQNRLTDEAKPIRSPIERLLLFPTDQSSAKTARVSIHPRAREELQKARAIIYSWGSFYTSVLSAFLVDGLADAVLQSNVPKILLLNPQPDAETLGKTPVDLVKELTQYAQRQSGVTGQAVTHVLALRSPASLSTQFYDPVYHEPIERLGARVIEIECEGLPKTEHLKTIKDRLLSLAQ